MNKHKLTESDKWFIEKGQVDTLSRTPFDVGHEVVVCDHKHVMLADFYDGTCPTCHSTITVNFGRRAVVYLKPLKHKEEFIKWFFPSRIARKIVPMINTALGWILGLVVAAVVVLVATGALSNELLLQRLEGVLVPKTGLLLSRIGNFWFSESVADKFASFGTVILIKNRIVYANAIAVLSTLSVDLWNLLTMLWSGFQRPRNKSKMLFECVSVRTQDLIELISSWISLTMITLNNTFRGVRV